MLYSAQFSDLGELRFANCSHDTSDQAEYDGEVWNPVVPVGGEHVDKHRTYCAHFTDEPQGHVMNLFLDEEHDNGQAAEQDHDTVNAEINTIC